VKVAIVVEAIPPYCGGGEQVAWVHAIEMAKKCEVAVVTFGETYSQTKQEGLDVYRLPFKKRNLVSYSTVDRASLNRCFDRINPSVIHCHMPHIISACLSKKNRLMVSTIHDGVPENELLEREYLNRAQYLKFKLIRRINVAKSDAITCVSQFSRDVMCSIYPRHAAKFSYIPNPIYERFFDPVEARDEGFVLNFGRQIPLKMGALIEAARLMPDTRFVFVGTGEMVREYGLPNVKFVGFSDAVEDYIDSASVCVFPSLSENFPLVGLEAMARGKPVIATQRGFSEYIQHMKNGFLLDSTDPVAIKFAIRQFMADRDLRLTIGTEARKTAEQYRPGLVVENYDRLYKSMLLRTGVELHSIDN
jgi:glycosyltransferase involved in cell wall biosynthesis